VFSDCMRGITAEAVVGVLHKMPHQPLPAQQGFPHDSLSALAYTTTVYVLFMGSQIKLGVLFWNVVFRHCLHIGSDCFASTVLYKEQMMCFYILHCLHVCLPALCKSETVLGSHHKTKYFRCKIKTEMS